MKTFKYPGGVIVTFVSGRESLPGPLEKHNNRSLQNPPWVLPIPCIFHLFLVNFARLFMKSFKYPGGVIITIVFGRESLPGPLKEAQ
jgi:hypothetical protein